MLRGSVGGTRPSRNKRGKAEKPADGLRIVIVDDHPLWRQTMRQVFDETDQVAVVAEASDGDEAIRVAGTTRPDVVLMDIDMPGVDGIAATRAITAANPEVRLLVLSASDARENVIGALSAGASGYLLKTSGAHDIRDGVARVAEGAVVLPASLAVHVVEQLQNPPATHRSHDSIDELSDREREVLALMADGHSNPAICNAVHLSPKTVEGYIASIFTKLGLEPTRDHNRRVLAVLRFLEVQSEMGVP